MDSNDQKQPDLVDAPDVTNMQVIEDRLNAIESNIEMLAAEIENNTQLIREELANRDSEISIEPSSVSDSNNRSWRLTKIKCCK